MTANLNPLPTILSFQKNTNPHQISQLNPILSSTQNQPLKITQIQKTQSLDHS